MRLVIFLMPLIGKLSYKSVLRLGKWLGLLMLKLAKSRREIAKKNIELCFPDYPEARQRQLLRDNFIATGQGLIETAFVWTVPGERLKEISSLHGDEHLTTAKASGKGVILLGFHLTSLELGGNTLANYHPMAAMYRMHRNPDFEHAMTSGREQHVTHMIERQDVRSMLKALKSGETIWYAADQDYGPKHSVFAPFFGIPAASIVATSRFVKMSGAKVVPMTHFRDLKTGHFHIRIHPELDDFADLDEQQAAERVNLFLENYLRGHPADYMWLHRRFKTRPEGQPGLYKPKSIMRLRRMVAKQYENSLASSKLLEGTTERPELVLRNDGHYIRIFYDKKWYQRSPARAFARQAEKQRKIEIRELFTYPEVNQEIAFYLQKDD